MDFAEFNAFHMPALEREEAKHCLLISLMERAAAEGPEARTQKWSLGEPGACAVRTPGRGLVVGVCTHDQCRSLAEQIAGTRFNSVLGADQVPLWIMERARELGEEFDLAMAQRIHQLSESPVYPGASGAARPVTSEHTELFADWYTAFAMEAAPEDPRPSREEGFRKAESGDCMFWFDGPRPVSMAGVVRRTRNTAAVALVYTPPELRGRGYAGSVTAAVVDKIYAEGRQTACLYTDLKNPASNRCYAKIGFKPICESWFFLQKRKDEPSAETQA